MPAQRKYLPLLGWLALCFSASATAIFVTTGGWYANLHMPAWNPPPWVFAPVWTTLYAMMAVAAWLVWSSGGWKPVRPFLLQWLLNVLWTPLFFGLHLLGAAFIEISFLWLSILATMLTFWRVSRVAAAMLLPYLAWVSFAGALNFVIWRLNS